MPCYGPLQVNKRRSGVCSAIGEYAAEHVTHTVHVGLGDVQHGFDHRVIQAEIFQSGRGEYNAQRAIENSDFSHAAVSGSLIGRNQAVGVHSKVRVLLFGLFDSAHEEQDEAAAILEFRHPGLAVILIEIFFSANGAGSESVGHAGVISAGEAVLPR